MTKHPIEEWLERWVAGESLSVFADEAGVSRQRVHAALKRSPRFEAARAAVDERRARRCEGCNKRMPGSERKFCDVCWYLERAVDSDQFRSGQLCYEARRYQGWSWRRIAAEFLPHRPPDKGRRYAFDIARRYALRLGKPWPPLARQRGKDAD